MGTASPADEPQPTGLHQLLEAVLGLLLCNATELHHLPPSDSPVGLDVGQDSCLRVNWFLNACPQMQRQTIRRPISLEQASLSQVVQHSSGVGLISLQQRRQYRCVHRSIAPPLPQGQ